MSTTVASGSQGRAVTGDAGGRAATAPQAHEAAAAQRMRAQASEAAGERFDSASSVRRYKATRRPRAGGPDSGGAGGFGASGSASEGKRDWGLVFSGVALIAAGLIVALWPGLTLVALAAFVGVMMLVAGAFDLIAYARFRKAMERAGWVLVNALCNIALGAVLLLHPVITAAVIPWVAGAFVAAYGVVAIVSAARLRKAGPGWGLMLANGVVSVLCGMAFIFLPATFAVFLGVFLVMRGVTMATFGVIAPKSVPYV